MRNAELIRTESGWKQRGQSESRCIIQTSKEIRMKAEDRRDGEEGVVSRNIYRLTLAGPDEQSDVRVGGCKGQGGTKNDSQISGLDNWANGWAVFL